MRLISAKIRLYRILDGGDLMDYIKRTLEQKILDINRQKYVHHSYLDGLKRWNKAGLSKPL